MKIIKFLICFSFILFSVQSNAQDKNDLDSMINASILEYVKITNDYIKGGFRLGNINDYSNVYILTYNLPKTFEFSSEVKMLGFKIISNFSIPHKLFKKGKSVLRFLKPIIDENKTIITLDVVSVKSKRKIFNFIGKKFIYIGVSNDGAVIFTWKYSQELEKWTLIDVKDAGI